MNHGSVQGRGKRFLSSPECSDWLWDLSSLPFGLYCEILCQSLGLGVEVTSLSPSRAQVKSECDYTFTSPYDFVASAGSTLH